MPSWKIKKWRLKDLGGTSTSGCTPGCGTSKRNIENFESSDKGDLKCLPSQGNIYGIVSPLSFRTEPQLIGEGEWQEFIEGSSHELPIFHFLLKKRSKFHIKFILDLKRLINWEDWVSAQKNLVDFGWFTIVAKPLLWFLKLTNKITGNFGIDIIHPQYPWSRSSSFH